MKKLPNNNNGTNCSVITADELISALAAHATILRPITEIGHDATFAAYRFFMLKMMAREKNQV